MTIYSPTNPELKYCVYLTIYRGNKLPPFYIGSTSIKKFVKGYKGSVTSRTYGEIWKNELKNNPYLFEGKIISKCLTRDEAFILENKLQRILDVVKNPLYINKGFAIRTSYTNRPGHKPTEETIRKLSVPNPKKGNSGSKNGMYGRTHTDTIKLEAAERARKTFKGKSYVELYGEEKANELKKKRSVSTKGKDNAGAKNPRARKIIIRFSDGKEVYCHGNLKKKCIEYGIPYRHVRGTLYTCVPTSEGIIAYFVY